MEMYKEFLEEYEGENRSVFYNDIGFATYYINGPECYIDNIYVKKDQRKRGSASLLADEIVKIAKEKGCTYLAGTVFTDQGNIERQTVSTQVLFGYGFKLSKAHPDKIVFVKEI